VLEIIEIKSAIRIGGVRMMDHAQDAGEIDIDCRTPQLVLGLGICQNSARIFARAFGVGLAAAAQRIVGIIPRIGHNDCPADAVFKVRILATSRHDRRDLIRGESISVGTSRANWALS